MLMQSGAFEERREFTSSQTMPLKNVKYGVCWFVHVLCSLCAHIVVSVVCVLDERGRGSREAPGPGCGWFASHTGLSEENTGHEGETCSTAGPAQYTTQRSCGHTTE